MKSAAVYQTDTGLGMDTGKLGASIVPAGCALGPSLQRDALDSPSFHNGVRIMGRSTGRNLRQRRRKQQIKKKLAQTSKQARKLARRAKKAAA
jgi:hypothetical protein